MMTTAYPPMTQLPGLPSCPVGNMSWWNFSHHCYILLHSVVMNSNDMWFFSIFISIIIVSWKQYHYIPIHTMSLCSLHCGNFEREIKASISILFAVRHSNLKQKTTHPWLYNPQITLIRSQGKEHVKSLKSWLVQSGPLPVIQGFNPQPTHC